MFYPDHLCPDHICCDSTNRTSTKEVTYLSYVSHLPWEKARQKLLFQCVMHLRTYRYMLAPLSPPEALGGKGGDLIKQVVK